MERKEAKMECTENGLDGEKRKDSCEKRTG